MSLPFIVRVYGLYVTGDKKLLVSDEFVKGKNITKFPGGGLQFGEGLRDCLRREMMEETGYVFKVLDHFYTTDFFAPSAFDETLQMISVYYRMKPESVFNIQIADMPFDFKTDKAEMQSFRLLSLDTLKKEDFTLVIDQHVAELISLK